MIRIRLNSNAKLLKEYTEENFVDDVARHVYEYDLNQLQQDVIDVLPRGSKVIQVDDVSNNTSRPEVKMLIQTNRYNDADKLSRSLNQSLTTLGYVNPRVTAFYRSSDNGYYYELYIESRQYVYDNESTVTANPDAKKLQYIISTDNFNKLRRFLETPHKTWDYDKEVLSKVYAILAEHDLILEDSVMGDSGEVLVINTTTDDIIYSFNYEEFLWAVADILVDNDCDTESSARAIADMVIDSL